MAKVVQLRIRRSVKTLRCELEQLDTPISSATYLEMVDIVESLIEEVRPDRLVSARGTLALIRWNAHFNPHFREDTKNEMQRIMQDLYAEAQ
jgi:hypothetical protein